MEKLRSDLRAIGEVASAAERKLESSVYFSEFLKAAKLSRRLQVLAHDRPGHLGHVKISARVDRDPARRDELAGRFAATDISQPREQLSFTRENAQPWTQIRDILVDRHTRSQLAEVAERIPPAIHVERAGAMHVVPLRLELAVRIEDLHAVILAVCNVDVAVLVRADVVHDIELSRIRSWLAPGKHQLSVGRTFVNARVAVAVGDVYLILRRKRHMGATVERLAALIGRRLAWNP